MNLTADIEFITPLFSKGMTEEPEIRPASIRGQLHWWFRALGGSFEEECAVFGKIGGKKEKTFSSPLVVRVSDIQGTTGLSPTLPHKAGGRRGHEAPKPCYLPGTRCKVHFLLRRSLPEDAKARLQQCIETWLLVGSLGGRTTRGAGSFMWNGWIAVPAQEYWNRISKIKNNIKELKFAFLKPTENTLGMNAEELRTVCTDTLGGLSYKKSDSDFSKLKYPLGNVAMGREKRGDEPTRKTSPLRFRLVRVREGDFIVAIWDNRKPITDNTEEHLQKVCDLLAQRGKPIGSLLKNASFI